MNRIILYIFFILLASQDASASTTTESVIQPKKPSVVSTSTPLQISPKATSTIERATTSPSTLSATTTNQIPEQATTTPIFASTTESSVVSEQAVATATPVDENLSKLYGNVDPISLDVSTTSLNLISSSSEELLGEALPMSTDITNDDQLSTQSGVASTAPQGFFASLSYLSSNVVIKLLGSLALIFLLAAIIFLLLSKRHERRNVD